MHARCILFPLHLQSHTRQLNEVQLRIDTAHDKQRLAEQQASDREQQVHALRRQIDELRSQLDTQTAQAKDAQKQASTLEQEREHLRQQLQRQV